AIGRAIAAIDQEVRRAVGENEARTDQEFWLVGYLGIVEFLVGPHHPGQRVLIGDADDGKTQFARLMHIGLRMRPAAQERKIRRDADFGVSHIVHANSPCTNQLEGAASPSAVTSSLP